MKSTTNKGVLVDSEPKSPVDENIPVMTSSFFVFQPSVHVFHTDSCRRSQMQAGL